MNITKLLGDFYDANVFIIEKNGQCLIIDSGAKIEYVKEAVGDKKVLAVLLTHGHFDHSIYCNDYALEFNCPVYCNNNIIKTFTDSEAMYSEDDSIIEDFSHLKYLNGNEEIEIGDFYVKSYYCPGHSVCCQCYVIDGIMFSGDVLFDRSIGRTDLKFSSKKDMYESLCKLEDVEFDYVCSGHGTESSHEDQLKNIKIYKRFLSR